MKPGKKIAEAHGDEEIAAMFRALQRAQYRQRVGIVICVVALAICATGVLMIIGWLPLWVPLSLCAINIVLSWYNPYQEKRKR